jgi:hypothetical protein
MTPDEIAAARAIEAQAVPLYRAKGRKPPKVNRPAETTFGEYRGVVQLERARRRVPPSTKHLRGRR